VNYLYDLATAGNIFPDIAELISDIFLFGNIRL